MDLNKYLSDLVATAVKWIAEYNKASDAVKKSPEMIAKAKAIDNIRQVIKAAMAKGLVSAAIADAVAKLTVNQVDGVQLKETASLPDDAIKAMHIGQQLSNNCDETSRMMVYKYLETLGLIKVQQLKHDNNSNEVDANEPYCIGTIIGTADNVKEDGHYGLVREVVDKNTGKKTYVQHPEFEKALNYIDKYLSKEPPIPVVVGVSHTNKGGLGHNEGTTDHFIVIVGMGKESGSKAYYYIDPARSGDSGKDVKANVLVQTAEKGKEHIFYDPKSPMGNSYTLTNVAIFNKDRVADEKESPIKKAESMLKTLGYNVGAVNGKMDGDTKAATEAFQKDYKIAVDGNLNKETLTALETAYNNKMNGGADNPQNNGNSSTDNNHSNNNNTIPISSAISGSVGKNADNKPADVALVQSLLVKQGYHLGNFGPNGDGVDGDCGKATISAISQFQQKTFGWQDGVVEVGGQTWAALTGTKPAPKTDAKKEESTPAPTGGGGSKPSWIAIAEKEDKVSEAGNYARVIEYINSTGYFEYTKTSERIVHWCASFVNWCMKKAGYSTVKYAAGVSQWNSFGTASDRPFYGAIAFNSSHIGFVVGYNPSTKKVTLLSGNYSDMVITVKNYDSVNNLTFRIPPGYTVPEEAYYY